MMEPNVEPPPQINNESMRPVAPMPMHAETDAVFVDGDETPLVQAADRLLEGPLGHTKHAQDQPGV